MIALSDLPAGWAIEPDDDGDNGDFCGLGKGAASVVKVRSVDHAEAQYSEGGNIPLLVHAVGVYPTEADADAAFEALRSALSNCSTFESDGTTFDVAPVSFPQVGDESIPLLFSGAIQGIKVTFYFVAIRVGEGLAIVGYGGIAPDVTEVEEFAQLAASKMQKAQTTQ